MKIFRDYDYALPGAKLQKFSILVTYRYTLLFTAIVMIFVLPPLLKNESRNLIALVFLLLMLTVLATLNLRKAFFLICLGLGIMASVFLFESWTYFLDEKHSSNFYLIGLSLSALFILVAVAVLIAKIFTRKEVTSETIKGAVSVYFLIGLLWAFIYFLIVSIEPGAINLTGESLNFSRILYFSFTTLTTLGYGDITPQSWIAQNMTILESALGQIYLAVLVARLVSLQLAGKSS